MWVLVQILVDTLLIHFPANGLQKAEEGGSGAWASATPMGVLEKAPGS